VSNQQATPYQNPEPDLQTRKPAIKMPAGATDSHSHIFGPREQYPYANPYYLPPKVLVEDYLRMLSIVGVERAVFVHAATYGTDNSLVLDVIASAPTRFRAIGLINESTTDTELERLHAGGVRGFRANLVSKIGAQLGEARRLADRVKSLGWHAQFLLDAEEFPEMDKTFGDFPVDVVIDHLGRPIIEQGVGAPGFQALLRLVRNGRAWSKLSAPYRTSRDPLRYRDIVPFAHALIEAAPDRLVWGTDWPHVNMAQGTPMPNDGDLCDQLAVWAPDEETRRKILVDNPARLYGFTD
jgi:2-pyrone-4,6-dicarboxylate lactonase